jgi:DNA repair exonuclease SbcCD ATPase subunit
MKKTFGSQDVERRENILKSFNGLSSQFRQIFLITHIEEMKEHGTFVDPQAHGLDQKARFYVRIREIKTKVRPRSLLGVPYVVRSLKNWKRKL